MNKDTNDDGGTFVSIGRIDIDRERLTTQPDTGDLPILPTRNLVLFPGVTIPISLGRENSITTAELASKRSLPIGIVCQLDPEVETPTVTGDLYKYGVIADVLKVFNLPDGSKTAIIYARDKFRIIGTGLHEVMPESQLSARIKISNEIVPGDRDDEYPLIIEGIKKQAEKLIEKSGERGETPGELMFNIRNSESPELLVNTICTQMLQETPVKEKLLATNRLKDRAFKLLGELNMINERVDISNQIMQRARSAMEQNQRNAFLQQQMDTIREELYGDDADDADDLMRRAEKASLPDNVMKTFTKEVEKLRRLNPSTPDYSVQHSYLETLLDLPWNKHSKLNADLGAAEQTLEHDHYGLEKVKERILEQIAVMMHNPKGRSPILCLVGPPGVGKTSLGQSVATALGREYQRVSLGGLHDEAEIRGHRRTYVGAMPGRIIDAMRRAKTSNPVLLLDEIDKIGRDFKGDPEAALLEVLDPEQNCRFHDNYIDIDYDLSKVMFIATANTLQGVSQPLIDRMEVIDLSGYLLEEKVEIAMRHLWPRIVEAHALDNPDIISPEAVKAIIENYTSESGVRQLEKKLATVARKSILAAKSGKPFPAKVMPEHLRDILGVQVYNRERYEGNEYAGVVTGLAWTSVGGEILLVESSLTPGKGDRLTLTGNLGDVMKESATIALQWVKAHATDLGINPALFDSYNLHIHFPEGAIPKDGPSAGITMATSIVSTFTQRRVRERLAMTGEITLRGKVLPVGGIKEKILAAKRAGITDIILSEENRKDIDDIAAKYIDGLTFHYVKTVMDVMRIAITDEPVADPVTLTPATGELKDGELPSPHRHTA